MAWYFLLFAMLGLAVGSFGNVLIVRIASGEHLYGRSHCVSCRREIPWHDLVPVFSYAFLSGRCRFCRRNISVRYPLVELGSAAIFVVSAAMYPLNFFPALFTAVLLAFLFFTCVFDLIHQRLPDLFTVVIAICALILVLLRGDLKTALFGAAVALVWFGGQWLVSRGRWVGSGDIFLAAVLGFWLGFMGSMAMLVLSYIIGALAITVLLVLRVITFRQKRVSFGPFLGVAALLAFFGAGEWYLSLMH